MTNKKGLLAAVLAVSCLGLPAFSGDFEAALSAPLAGVEVPGAGTPAAYMEVMAAAAYDDYYATLDFYSRFAMTADQESPEYFEIFMAGNYLRGRLQEVSANMGRWQPKSSKVNPSPSPRVLAELMDVFRGFGMRKDDPVGPPPLVIKPGYCSITFVKNGVPFLTQSDSFLRRGEVVITFDDGPEAASAESVADMEAGGVSALYFALGSKIGQTGRRVLAAAAAAGQEVGVHGFHHATESGRPFTAYADDKVLSDISLASDRIERVTGKKPRFFRPPYGIINPSALQLLIEEPGLVPVGWTVDTLDWSTKDPMELLENTKRLLTRRGKGIVLMHDIHPQSRQAARELLVWLAENNFKVVSPDKLERAFRN